MSEKRSNARKLQRTNKGQWIITIPSSIAEALGLKIGEIMNWKIERNNLVLRRENK